MDFDMLIKKISQVLAKPVSFFERLRKEKGIKEAFMYFAILGLFSTILGTIMGQLMRNVSMNLLSKLFGIKIPYIDYSIALIIVLSILGYGFRLLLSFVGAGMLHVWILIFGGKEDYAKTYQLYTYARTPSLVLGWIPFLSFFIWVYDLILLIIGTQKIHDISRNKAVLMYLIPVAIAGLLYLLIVILAIAVFTTMPELFANLTMQQ